MNRALALGEPTVSRRSLPYTIGGFGLKTGYFSDANIERYEACIGHSQVALTVIELTDSFYEKSVQAEELHLLLKGNDFDHSDAAFVNLVQSRMISVIFTNIYTDALRLRWHIFAWPRAICRALPTPPFLQVSFVSNFPSFFT